MLRLTDIFTKYFIIVRPIKCYRKIYNNLIFSPIPTCKPSTPWSLKLDFSTQPIFRRFYQNKASVGLGVKPLHMNKDVILYYNDNASFYKYLNLFSFSQFVFWTYLSHFSYTTMKDTPVTEAELENAKKSFKTDTPTFVPVWRQFNIGKYKEVISVMSGIIGFAALIVTTLYTKNCVKSLVLLKGNEKITLQFFSLLGKGKQLTVPITDISARNSRQNAKSYIVLNMKNRKLYLILDMRGKFPNKQLFDTTAGLRRAWAN